MGKTFKTVDEVIVANDKFNDRKHIRPFAKKAFGGKSRSSVRTQLAMYERDLNNRH